ncbi:MAG: GNAT family N-acetyltransferase [Chloroflexota bacterium]|nr:GNAT family N-acetyltransferase [Chloroflexota bacterium]MDQ3688720.1 GNAT family N-acetyltransferase [Chloroflexota bacterium]
MSLRIRPMGVRDASAVAKLTGELGYPVEEADLVERLAVVLADPADHLVLVAVEEDDVPVGWCHVERLRILERPPAAQLMGLVVGAEHRSRGIGSALLGASEAAARAWGCQALLIRSNVKRERAHGFYEGAGYAKEKVSFTFTKRLTDEGMDQTDAESDARRMHAFYRGLPAKRVGAAMLLTDASGRLLLVRPTNKPGWEAPGGLVDRDEAPHLAVVREVAEELGLHLGQGRLLCMDWIPARHPKTDGLMLIFDGGTLDAATIHTIRLPADELSEYRLVPPAELDDYLPVHMARRVREAIRAREEGSTLYLVDGHALDGS